MNIIIEEFDNIKISALNKAKLVSKDIHDVTIGPNCLQNVTEKVQQKTKSTKNVQNDALRNEGEKVQYKDKIAFGKILAEAELQRRNEVEVNIMTRIALIETASQKFDSDLQSEWARRQKMLIEQNQEQEQMMLKILQEHDKKAFDLSEQLQLQYQKQQDEKQRRINLEIQNKERERQLLLLVEKIHDQQIAFRTVYQEIVGILKGCANPKSINKIISNHSTIKSLPESMDKLKEKCKILKVADADLELAKSLVQEILKLKDIISLEVVQSNEKEKLDLELEKQKVELAKVQEQEKLRLEQEKINAQKQIESKQTEILSQKVSTSISQQSSTDTDCTFISKENLHMYAELQQYLDNYENSFKNVFDDPKFKKFKFACQKAVNTPLNAISGVNSHHLTDKYIKLINLLSGKTVVAGGTQVCAAQLPQGIPYCMNLLAKKFVLQGDLIVSSNPESAYCLSAVIVALWIDFPDFGKLILAHFQKEVPYLVPMYPVMVSGQNEQDYFKSLGYHYTDGVVEKQDKFLKRMSGIMRLYSAVMISRLKRAHQGRTHPHGLCHAWRWFASMLNLEPRVDITATLLYEFLEVAGSSMQAAYGNQFNKILTYLNDEYFPRIQKIDTGGPMTRLEVFLKNAKSKGHIEPPKGRIPEGFW